MNCSSFVRLNVEEKLLNIYFQSLLLIQIIENGMKIPSSCRHKWTQRGNWKMYFSKSNLIYTEYGIGREGLNLCKMKFMRMICV